MLAGSDVQEWASILSNLDFLMHSAGNFAAFCELLLLAAPSAPVGVKTVTGGSWGLRVSGAGMGFGAMSALPNPWERGCKTRQGGFSSFRSHYRCKTTDRAEVLTAAHPAPGRALTPGEGSGRGFSEWCSEMCKNGGQWKN